ncbi:MAG TPA: glutathione S-transferase N-terminal domain-containing protein [Candidatus Paceibacterota bacterium]|nr:glutathione S-transferase N-terminal domain-containing protein [Candidatus Paceibacterota bacterium]
MTTLYVKTGCPFSAKAIGALDAYGVPYELKNIADPGVADELTEKGGKLQVPFLEDGETSMYESDGIVAYVESTYGTGSAEIETTDGGTCPA